MGRATGNVRNELEENCGPGVMPKVLTTEKDYIAAEKYVDYIKKFISFGTASPDGRTFTLQINDLEAMEYKNPSKRRLGQQRKRTKKNSKQKKRRLP